MAEVKVEYPLEGSYVTFDASANKTEKFGLFYQDRVLLPDVGEATVVGIRNDTIWFLPDGASDPIKFDGIKDANDIKTFQIKKLKDSASAAINLTEGYIRGEHKVRQIKFKGKTVSMIMQNENGPCPLVAIANVLSLRGDINLSTKSSVISLVDLCGTVGAYIKQQGQDAANYSKQIADVIINPTDVLQFLQSGLDVNPCFASNTAFTHSFATELMAMFKMPLYHSWIVSPDTDGYELIMKLDYDALAQSYLMAEHTVNEKRKELESAKLGGAIPNLPPSDHSNVSNSETSMQVDIDQADKERPAVTQSDEQSMRGTETDGSSIPSEITVSDRESLILRLEKEVEDSERDSRQLHLFLNEYSFSQYTPYGVLLLQQTFQEGDLGVYFKNSHFFTLHMRKGQLYTLVTDIGYAREDHVVWETLDVGMDTLLVDSEFVSSNDRQREESIRKIMDHNPGFTTAEVGAAYDEVLNSGNTTSISLTQVIQILKSKTISGVDQSKVQQLMEMGYDKRAAESALKQSNGDLVRALDLL